VLGNPYAATGIVTLWRFSENIPARPECPGRALLFYGPNHQAVLDIPRVLVAE
jgi:hypothetical protein